MKTTIEAMHAIFLQHSRLDSKLSSHERTWYELVKGGYSPDDVDIFCRWILHENSQQEDVRYKRRFHIPRMFGDLGEFDADLSLAKAWYRNRRLPPTTREQALQDLRPSVDPELEKARLNPARSARDVLAQVLKNASEA
jgi:hypothetical protein